MFVYGSVATLRLKRCRFLSTSPPTAAPAWLQLALAPLRTPPHSSERAGAVGRVGLTRRVTTDDSAYMGGHFADDNTRTCVGHVVACTRVFNPGQTSVRNKRTTTRTPGKQAHDNTYPVASPPTKCEWRDTSVSLKVNRVRGQGSERHAHEAAHLGLPHALVLLYRTRAIELRQQKAMVRLRLGLRQNALVRMRPRALVQHGLRRWWRHWRRQSLRGSRLRMVRGR